MTTASALTMTVENQRLPASPKSKLAAVQKLSCDLHPWAKPPCRMASHPPSPDLLYQLRDLDQSAPEFPNCLRCLLIGQRYSDCVATLQREDLAWLVEFLSTVRLRLVFTDPRPNQA